MTIFLGLPIARIDRAGVRLRAMLNYFSIGILLFLLIEVTEHSWFEVELSAEKAAAGAEGWDLPARFFLIFVAGVLLGMLSLVWFENRFVRDGAKPEEPAGPAPNAERAQRLALMIAVGIGLHNFSEGLAIGASAAAGALSLAVALGVGFGLHNATEGFGIAAPRTGTKPSWQFLGICGVIGGG